MKIAIIGSRTFNDYELLRQSLDEFSFEANVDISLIVSGGANGADSLGERYAHENNIETLIFLPDWKNMVRVLASSETNLSLIMLTSSLLSGMGKVLGLCQV